MRPGQIRKEAATAGTLCAGVWLVGLPPIFEFVVARVHRNAPLELPSLSSSPAINRLRQLSPAFLQANAAIEQGADAILALLH